MAQLHAVGASIVLGAVLVTGLIATFAALRGGSPWTDRLRPGLTVVIGLQVAGGVALYVSGARPNESLHLLYGLATLAILPLASTFAAQAPPRARGWVLVASCAILLAMAWRLGSTG